MFETPTQFEFLAISIRPCSYTCSYKGVKWTRLIRRDLDCSARRKKTDYMRSVRCDPYDLVLQRHRVIVGRPLLYHVTSFRSAISHVTCRLSSLAAYDDMNMYWALRNTCTVITRQNYGFLWIVARFCRASLSNGRYTFLRMPCRVESSEISGNLSVTYVSQLFPSPTLQNDAVKQAVLDKQLSRSLCFNFTHYVQKK